MKIRTGFVSNSSASSFVCNICNKIESFGNGPEQYDSWKFVTCERGHDFCEKHMTNNIFEKINSEDNPLELYQKLHREIYNDTELEYDERDLHDDFINNDSVSDMLYDLRYSCPSEYCPICSFENISNVDFLKYYFKKNNVNRKVIAKIFKEEFGDYKKLLEYIKS